MRGGGFYAAVVSLAVNGEDIILLDADLSARLERHTSVAKEHVLAAATMIGAVGFEQVAAELDIEFFLEIAGQVFKDGVDIGDEDSVAMHDGLCIVRAKNSETVCYIFSAGEIGKFCRLRTVEF